MKKSGKSIIKHIHLFVGIIFLIASFIAFPISLTGFSIVNEPTKLYIIQGVLFLIAIFEIYLAIKIK
ncbi:MAG: hypothetical protein ACP5NZ_00815 [Nanobdellota archaeon]